MLSVCLSVQMSSSVQLTSLTDADEILHSCGMYTPEDVHEKG